MGPLDDISKLNTKDIFKNRPLGKGAFGTVYPHPTKKDVVIKIPNSFTQKTLPEQIMEQPLRKQIVPNRNYGQPIAKGVTPSTYVPGDYKETNIEFLRRVKGRTNRSLIENSQYPREYMRQLNFLRKIPQENINNLRQDFKVIQNAGGFLDAHPGNIIVDRKNFKVTPIDTGLTENSIKDPFAWKNEKAMWKDVNMWNALTGTGSLRDAEATIPRGRTVLGDMTPMRTEAMKKALAIFADKLRLAGIAVPIVTMPSQILGASGLYNNIKEQGPTQGYMKWLGFDAQPRKWY